MLIPQQNSSTALYGNNDRYTALELRKEILQEVLLLANATAVPARSRSLFGYGYGFEDPFEEEESEIHPHPRLVIREISPTPNVIVTKQDYETLLEEPDVSRILRVESTNSILKTPESKAPKTTAPEEEEEEVLQEEEDAPEEEEEAPEEEEEEEEDVDNDTRQTILIKGVAHSMDTITSMVYTLKGDLIGKLVNGKLVRNSSEK